MEKKMKRLLKEVYTANRAVKDGVEALARSLWALDEALSKSLGKLNVLEARLHGASEEDELERAADEGRLGKARHKGGR